MAPPKPVLSLKARRRTPVAESMHVATKAKSHAAAAERVLAARATPASLRAVDVAPPSHPEALSLSLSQESFELRVTTQDVWRADADAGEARAFVGPSAGGCAEDASRRERRVESAARGAQV